MHITGIFMKKCLKKFRLANFLLLILLIKMQVFTTKLVMRKE